MATTGAVLIPDIIGAARSRPNSKLQHLSLILKSIEIHSLPVFKKDILVRPYFGFPPLLLPGYNSQLGSGTIHITIRCHPTGCASRHTCDHIMCLYWYTKASKVTNTSECPLEMPGAIDVINPTPTLHYNPSINKRIPINNQLIIRCLTPNIGSTPKGQCQRVFWRGGCWLLWRCCSCCCC